MHSQTPKAEIAADAALARRLLAAQHPDLAGLAIGAPQEGWDNVTLPLAAGPSGAAMALRLPRRQVAAGLILHEQDWLPRLAPTLPIAVPAPLRRGVPASFFPWHWSVLPWFEGRTADIAPPAPAEAEALADFLRALHRPAPADAPVNPFRATPLSARDAATRARLSRIAGQGDWVTPGLAALWGRAVAAPVPAARVLIHGDLHARNVLVRAGGIVAILDWGDLTAGDAATDIAAFWLLFDDAGARRAGLARYGVDPAAILRAMGWALAMAAVHLDTGLADHPAHARIGAAALARLDADLIDFQRA